jgi:putative transposase
MSRTRYKFHEAEHPYFFTCTIVGWLPIFTRPECVRIVFDSWKFLQDNNRIQLFAYVILENHLHGIGISEDMSKQIGQFKSFTARKILDYLESRAERGILEQIVQQKLRHKIDREYQLWQEGSHPQQITTSEMMEQKIEYIRGYVEEPKHWMYSSARNYAGLPASLEIVTDWIC